MPKSSETKSYNYYMFVLWGERFDETIATAFITGFRREGFRAKLIGLQGRRSTGAYGLTLFSDLTLGEALPLAKNALCVVIPCDSSYITRYENDPRLHEFFCQAQANHARFVVNQESKSKLFNFQTPLLSAGHMAYSAGENLVEFVHKICKLCTGQVEVEVNEDAR